MKTRNRIKENASNRIARDKRRVLYRSLLGGVCVECNSTNNLEFDHVIPEDLGFRIGSHLGFSLEYVLPELQKCQLLCKPCHKVKTKSDVSARPSVPIKHGTAGGYTNRGCRCQECKNAWTKYTVPYKNDYRDRLRLIKLGGLF